MHLIHSSQLIACLACISAACAETAAPVEQNKADALSVESLEQSIEQLIISQMKEMERYSENPTLEKAAEILSFDVNEYNFTYRVGYYAQLYRRYDAQRDELISRCTPPTNYIARFAHCTAEWLSGAPACEKDAFLQLEYDPIMKGALKINKNTPRPDFTRLEALEAGIDETNLLDMAWGAYDATHDREILASFIRCAARTAPPEKDAVRYWSAQNDQQRIPYPPELKDKDVVAMAAKWSVHSRAKQNAAFAAEVEECLKTLPEEVQNQFRAPLPPDKNNDREYSPE